MLLCICIYFYFISGPGRGAQEAAAPPAPRQRVGGERAVRGRPRPYELGASRCDSTEEPTQKSPPVQREIHQRKWLRATAPRISIESVLVLVRVLVLISALAFCFLVVLTTRSIDMRISIYTDSIAIDMRGKTSYNRTRFW